MKIFVLDSQRLDAIQTCSFLYHTKFTDNLVNINTPLYLERGGLLHEMLSVYYNVKKHRINWHKNHKTHLDVVRSCIIAGRTAAIKTQMDISEVEETVHTFLQYTDHWENDGWDNIIAVEKVASKILYQDAQLCILYEGKIDLVLSLSGNIIPVDHKSSSSRREPNYLSNQFKGYCFLLGCNNLIQNEIGFQKTVKSIDKFRRHTISFSDAILSEWVDNTLYWVENQLSLDEKGLNPRNFTSCDKYLGCELKQICMSDPGEFREYKMKESLKEKVWDVNALEVVK